MRRITPGQPIRLRDTIRAGCTVALVLAIAAAPAAAQTAGGDSSTDLSPGASPSAGPSHHHGRGASNGPAKGATPPPAPPQAQAPWPRLDPGAVLCQTPEDLRQRAAAMANYLNGSASRVVQPPGCRVIQLPAGVVVLDRQGPGQTQVRTTGAAAVTGWTDAYLPETSPGK